MLRPSFRVLVALFTFAVPALAHAGTVGTAVAGQASPELRAAASSALDAALTAAGHAPEPMAAATELEGCARAGGAGCAGVLAGLPAHDRLLVVSLEPEADGDRVVALTAWWLGTDGAVLRAEQRYCERCDGARVGRNVTELVALLASDAADGLRTVIAVRSTPTGAVVAIDGNPVGLTALDYAVTPGRHRIRVTLDGYRAEERAVSVVGGATASVAIELSREAAPGRGRKVAGWSLVGAGVGLVAVGAWMVAIDEDEGAADGFRPAEVNDSAPWGYGLGGAGVAAASVGLWLLVTGGGDEGAPPAVTATIDQEGEPWLVARGRF